MKTKIKIGDIQERWQDRVLANRWQTLGELGADAYIKHYGRNIGNEKLFALAEYADDRGYPHFATGLYKYANASKLNEQQKRVLIKRALHS